MPAKIPPLKSSQKYAHGANLQFIFHLQHINCHPPATSHFADNRIIIYLYGCIRRLRLHHLTIHNLPTKTTLYIQQPIMKTATRFMAALSAGTALALAGCSHSEAPQAPVALTWEIDSLTAESGNYVNSFTIKNISDAPLDGAWEIYYTQMPRNLQQDKDAPVTVEFVTAHAIVCVRPATIAPIEPGDSIVVTFTGQGSVPTARSLPKAHTSWPQPASARIFRCRLIWSRPHCP